jgi:uncharacterized protein (TIGR03435 family)
MHGKRIAAIFFTVAFAGAQEVTSFEVASVKISAPDGRRTSGGGPGTSSPGQYHFMQATLQDLLAVAFQVQYFQLVSKASLQGGRFDVVAKVPVGATRDQFRTMMQNLLAERFHLKLHHETREFPAWEIVIAKSGLKITESNGANAPGPQSGTWAPGQVGKDGFPVTASGNALAAMYTTVDGYLVGRITARQQPVSALANNGFGAPDATPPIVDHTGLTGKYDFRLEFSREFLGAPPGDAKSPPAPDLFTAFREQLGLQLTPKKLPFDVLVIESFDAVPAEN